MAANLTTTYASQILDLLGLSKFKGGGHAPLSLLYIVFSGGSRGVGGVGVGPGMITPPPPPLELVPILKTYAKCA